LKATIVPGQPGTVTYVALAAGKADFAAVDFVSAVRLRPTYPFRVVAAVQQRTLLGLASLKKNRIEKPADLDGKKIGAPVDGAV
jgi:NitT/TauT family transport system substrate-binding protein